MRLAAGTALLALLAAGCAAPERAPSSASPATEASSAPTASGFVDHAAVVFEDRTAGSGLEGFRLRAGSAGKDFLPETMSAGLALLDYDHDGRLDVYLLNGSTWDAMAGREAHPRAALFRNLGDGAFEEVTARAGLANEGWGMGVAVGDFDGDGWPDLFVANFGTDRLYRNNGDGTFTDVAEQARVAVGDWSAGASFGDLDRDGDLDLFVSGYAAIDTRQLERYRCRHGEYFIPCGPEGLDGERDYLFVNQGDGTFRESAESAGVADPEELYGFAATWVDLDDDGWLDLLVVNDSVPNYYYRNRGDGSFEDLSFVSGFAVSAEGVPQGGMGLAVGDYDRDGRLDLFVTNYFRQDNALYRNLGEATFRDVTAEAGLSKSTRPFVGWGTAFTDFDNDGHRDLFAANGHIFPRVGEFGWSSSYAQRPLLFRNVGGQRFEEVPAARGSGLGILPSARGAAFGDLDHDGRVDIVLNCLDDSPKLLANRAPPGHHWLIARLLGRAASPPDAIGATAFLTAGGATQRGDVLSGASYLSQSDQRLHFGLGGAETVDRLEIRWPSGRRQRVLRPPADRILTIVEGR